MLFPILTACFLIGAIAGRIRGAGLVSDIVARFIVWGAPVGLLVYLTSMDLSAAGIALIAAGLGASPGYWGNFDLTVPANCTWHNYAKLSVMGMFRFFVLFATALPFYYFADDALKLNPWAILPGVLGGLAFVPAYLAGIQIADRVQLPLLAVFSEWGEFLFWGSIYTALAAGLILADGLNL
jgi:hypothetical protein